MAGRRVQPVTERVIGGGQLLQLAALVAHLTAALALQPLQQQLALSRLAQPVLELRAVLEDCGTCSETVEPR